MNSPKVAVASRSFSKNPILRKELLARYTQVTFNDEGAIYSGEKLVSFLRGHDRAIIGLERVDDVLLSKLPDLKIISKYGVGTDAIDFTALKRYGVRFGWTGGVNKRSVTELVIAMAIVLLRQLSPANQSVRAGEWTPLNGNQLTGKTVGIIGLGNIGKDLVKLLQPWECKILANDLLDFPEFCSEYQVRPASLEAILGESDLITLHIPYNESTHQLLSADKLKLLRSHAFIINTARGNIVDETALKELLITKKIAGAAFDVFTHEPPRDLELLKLPNFFATPHLGGSSYEAVLAMGRAAILGLEV